MYYDPRVELSRQPGKQCKEIRSTILHQSWTHFSPFNDYKWQCFIREQLLITIKILINQKISSCGRKIISRCHNVLRLSKVSHEYLSFLIVKVWSIIYLLCLQCPLSQQQLANYPKFHKARTLKVRWVSKQLSTNTTQSHSTTHYHFPYTTTTTTNTTTTTLPLPATTTYHF